MKLLWDDYSSTIYTAPHIYVFEPNLYSLVDVDANSYLVMSGKNLFAKIKEDASFGKQIDNITEGTVDGKRCYEYTNPYHDLDCHLSMKNPDAYFIKPGDTKMSCNIFGVFIDVEIDATYTDKESFTRTYDGCKLFIDQKLTGSISCHGAIESASISHLNVKNPNFLDAYEVRVKAYHRMITVRIIKTVDGKIKYCSRLENGSWDL